jgi:hypothetical protein
MKTSIVSAALAALCTASANASALFRVRTLSTRKSLPASLRGRRDNNREAFLDIEQTFRRLEFSISTSLSLSAPNWEGGSRDGEWSADKRLRKITHAAAATAQVESIAATLG